MRDRDSMGLDMERGRMAFEEAVGKVVDGSDHKRRAPPGRWSFRSIPR